jgi:hypothetical protein
MVQIIDHFMALVAGGLFYLAKMQDYIPKGVPAAAADPQLPGVALGTAGLLAIIYLVRRFK